MKIRKLVLLVPLLASPIAGGFISTHTVQASTNLKYEAQIDTDNGYFDADGPTGRNSSTPTYADFDCDGHYGSTYFGWTVNGTVTVRAYSTKLASEEDSRAPALVSVKLTDAAGDTASITGAGVFSNTPDSFVSGSFTISYTGADGSTATCTLRSTDRYASGEAEME